MSLATVKDHDRPARRTRIRTRLVWGFGALLLLSAFGMAVGLMAIISLSVNERSQVAQLVELSDSAQRMRMELGNRSLLLMREPAGRDPGLLKELSQSSVRFEAALRSARALSVSPGIMASIDQLELAHQQLDRTIESYFHEVGPLLRQEPVTSAVSLLDDAVASFQQLSLDQLSHSQQERASRAVFLAWSIGVTMFATFLIAILSAVLLARSLSRPLEAIAEWSFKIDQHDGPEGPVPRSDVLEVDHVSQRMQALADFMQQMKSINAESLLAQQQQLSSVIESINDGLVIFGPGGRAREMNPVALRQLGLSTECLPEFLGKLLQRPEIDAHVAAVVAGTDTESAIEELSIETSEGLRKLDYSLAKTSDGAGAVMVLRDMTEERAFESVRSEFVLRASHELRTPVTGMRMAFGLLQERLRFDEESREADLMQTVNEEMNRLVRLLNDLLDFSRYQSGAQKLEKQATDLALLVESVQARFLGPAAEAQVSLHVDIDSGLPRLPLDQSAINRVFDNLLANAIRHTPARGSVDVSCKRLGKLIEFAVSDTGEGIPYAQQARIFNPFVQVGSKKGSAGLGLSLAREIVSLHGGVLRLNSTPGRGTRFFFRLDPLRADAALPVARA